MTDQEWRDRWKVYNDQNHEKKSGDNLIKLGGLEVLAPEKYDGGDIIDEENYFHARETFRYVVNDPTRFAEFMKSMGYKTDERQGAKLGLINEIARHYHTDVYPYDKIKKDLGSEMFDLDNESKDFIRSLKL